MVAISGLSRGPPRLPHQGSLSAPTQWLRCLADGAASPTARRLPTRSVPTSGTWKGGDSYPCATAASILRSKFRGLASAPSPQRRRLPPGCLETLTSAGGRCTEATKESLRGRVVRWRGRGEGIARPLQPNQGAQWPTGRWPGQVAQERWCQDWKEGERRWLSTGSCVQIGRHAAIYGPRSNRTV